MEKMTVKETYNEAYKIIKAKYTKEKVPVIPEDRKIDLYDIIIGNIDQTDFSIVKQILSDTFLFYQKWSGNPDWVKLIDEARVLNKKYNIELCLDVVVELMDILHKEEVEKSKKEVA